MGRFVDEITNWEVNQPKLVFTNNRKQIKDTRNILNTYYETMLFLISFDPVITFKIYGPAASVDFYSSPLPHPPGPCGQNANFYRPLKRENFSVFS